MGGRYLYLRSEFCARISVIFYIPILVGGHGLASVMYGIVSTEKCGLLSLCNVWFAVSLTSPLKHAGALRIRTISSYELTANSGVRILGWPKSVRRG